MSPDDYPNEKERRENLMRDDYRDQGTVNVTAWDPGQRPTKEEDKSPQMIVFVLSLVVAFVCLGLVIVMSKTMY